LDFACFAEVRLFSSWRSSASLIALAANAAVFSAGSEGSSSARIFCTHQEQLFAITGTAPGSPAERPLPWPDVSTCIGAARSLSFIVTKIMGTTLSIGDRAEVTGNGSIVSANYFDAIGVHPTLGRGFEPDEDTGGNAHPVTVISYQTVEGAVQGRPAIIGQTQRHHNVMHTISASRRKVFYGTFVAGRCQFWVPVSMEETLKRRLQTRGSAAHAGLKRTCAQPGVTQTQAQEEISAVAKQVGGRTFPATNRAAASSLWPLWQTPFQ